MTLTDAIPTENGASGENREAPSDGMLRKVRALLDKAEQTTFEAEQEALFAKAAELMARYRISEAMLAAAKPAADRSRIVERVINLGSGQYVRARLSLLASIADASCCQVVTWTTWEGRVAEVHGHESDVASVEILYTSLLVQATSGMRTAKPPRGTTGVAFRRSFLFGFANRVSERLAEVNQAAAADVDGAGGAASSGPGVAVVLANRAERVQSHVRERHGRLGRLSSVQPLRRDGWAVGQAAGDRADLHSARGVGGRSVAALDR